MTRRWTALLLGLCLLTLPGCAGAERAVPEEEPPAERVFEAPEQPPWQLCHSEIGTIGIFDLPGDIRTGEGLWRTDAPLLYAYAPDDGYVVFGVESGMDSVSRQYGVRYFRLDLETGALLDYGREASAAVGPYHDPDELRIDAVRMGPPSALVGATAAEDALYPRGAVREGDAIPYTYYDAHTLAPTEITFHAPGEAIPGRPETAPLLGVRRNPGNGDWFVVEGLETASDERELYCMVFDANGQFLDAQPVGAVDRGLYQGGAMRDYIVYNSCVYFSRIEYGESGAQGEPFHHYSVMEYAPYDGRLREIAGLDLYALYGLGEFRDPMGEEIEGLLLSVNAQGVWCRWPDPLDEWSLHFFGLEGEFDYFESKPYRDVPQRLGPAPDGGYYYLLPETKEEGR